MRRRGLYGRAMVAYRLLSEAKPQDFTRYTANFSELSFNSKLSRVGELLGDTLLLPLLRLYYIYCDQSVPLKAKAYITGALGYFILPLDFVPDFIPSLLGFGDDLIVVGIVLRQVEKYLTPATEARAQSKLNMILRRK